MTGVDFSPVGLAKAKRFADLWGVQVTWVESAVENWTPPPEGFDLVAMCYLQLPRPSRTAALAVAASAVAPGGTLLVIAHDVENLTRGYGGPPNPDVLYRVSEVTEAAVDAGLTIDRAEQAIRVVDTDDRPRDAVDTVVRANAARAVGKEDALPVLAWTLAAEVADQLGTEFPVEFVGRASDAIDVSIEVDRTRQHQAIHCHTSQASENPVLWRRLELQGDREVLRWLDPAEQGRPR